MTQNYFNIADYTLIAVYICGMLGLGIFLKKKASASLENYLVGGRTLPWWMLGISGMTQFFDVAGTMVITSFLFMMGPRGLYIEFRGGASLVLVVMLLWTGKWHRRSQCLTGAEWMIYRFGDGLAGRLAQLAKAITSIVVSIGLIAYMIKGIGLFLSMFLPYTPMTCALGMIAVTTLYTMFSGFYGVVLSDLFNAIVLIVSAIFITSISMEAAPDLQGLSELAELVTHNSQWTEVLPRLQTYMPPGYQQYEALLMFATIYIIRNLVVGCGAGDDPKYFGARSDKDCSKATLLWICLLAIRWPMMIGMAILGLFLVNDLLPDADIVQESVALIQSHQNIGEDEWHTMTSVIANNPDSQPNEMIAGLELLLGENWKTKLLLISSHGSVNPERIMPAVLLNYIPTGFRGLMIVAIFAASMSTFNSLINATSGLFVRDIYQKHIRPQANIRELIAAAWLFILALVCSSFAFAISLNSINEIWVWFLMSLGGGLMGPLVLRFYWWRFNGFGFAIGSLAGIAAAIAQWLASDLLVEKWHFLTSESWTLLITASIGLAGSIVGSLLTPPTPEHVLRKFYLTSLPFGLWSKFKQALPISLRKQVTAEHLRDLSAIPFALLFQILIYLSPMLMIIENWQSAVTCWILAGATFVGFYFIWLRHIGTSDEIVRQSRLLLESNVENSCSSPNC